MPRRPVLAAMGGEDVVASECGRRCTEHCDAAADKEDREYEGLLRRDFALLSIRSTNLKF